MRDWPSAAAGWNTTRDGRERMFHKSAGGLTGQRSPPGLTPQGAVLPSALAVLAFAAFVFAAVPGARADGAIGRGDGITAFADLADDGSVVVHYRVDGGGPVNGVEATLAGRTVTPRKHRAYPRGGDVSAVLFLVDTSDPARQAVVEQIGRDIAAIVRAAAPHHRFGLARFDSDLEVLAPLGSSAGDIAAAAATLRATGQTTELYRLTKPAVDLLAAFPADRRALYLFSDGKAEDIENEYGRAFVVDAANAAGVSISGLGYAIRTSEEVALQTLRRLADDTGGVFAKAPPGGGLPRDFLERPFARLDSGGRFEVGVRFAVWTGAGGERPLDLVFDRGGTAVPLRVALVLPPSPLLRFWPVPVILLVLAGGAVVWWFAAHGRREPPPMAMLEFLDEDGAAFPIRSGDVAIGRGENENDLVLTNDSVSWEHARLNRVGDGSFVILDRGSANGVRLNGELRQRETLANGDIIELGEVRLRFRVPG